MRRVQRSSLLDTMAVVWIILSSNSLLYCVMNMKMCMAVLFIIALLYLRKNTRISAKNLRVFIAVMGIVILNNAVNISYTNLFNENNAILLIRCFSLAVIMSNIERDDFFRKFVFIMITLCVISLVCFSLTMIAPGISLPFQVARWYKEKYYIYTFYHTLGRWRVEPRNCGIFWESAGYQIFLNLALLFLLLKPSVFLERVSRRKYLIMVLILVATILTTLSTAGYVCLAVVLAIRVLHGNSSAKEKRMLLALVILAGAALLFIESRWGIIESKAINHMGSYLTRYNDTVKSIRLGMERIVGYGYANEYTQSLLADQGVKDNSSGIGMLLISFGWPVTFMYLGYLWLRVKKTLSLSVLSASLVLCLLILFIMSENVYNTTLFISLLFFWKVSDLGNGEQMSE